MFYDTTKAGNTPFAHRSVLEAGPASTVETHPPLSHQWKQALPEGKGAYTKLKFVKS
jgi:hypothetical protein